MIEFINHYLVPGLVLGAIYGLGAVGVSMLFGILRFAHFAHGDLMTLGAYGALAAVTAFAIPAIYAIPAAVALAIAVALLIDQLCYRPLRHKPTMMSMIASFGVALMLRSAIQIVWGPQRAVYASGFTPPLRLFDALIIPVRHIQILAATLLLTLALHVFLAHTRTGRSMRAIADDPELAGVAGLDPERIIRWVWVLGAAFAAIAGVFVGLDNDIHTNLGWNMLMPVFASALLGGIGRPLGAMVGGLIIGLSEELSAYPLFGEFGLISPSYKSAVAFVIMVALLIVRPQGLFKGRVF